MTDRQLQKMLGARSTNNDRLADTARPNVFSRPPFGRPLTVAHIDGTAYQMKHADLEKCANRQLQRLRPSRSA
jgi:hypothetical protein